MSFIFGEKKQQTTPTVLNVVGDTGPSAAELEAEATAKAEAAEKERRKRAKGGAATILTSGEGLIGQANILSKTLLGE